MSSASHAKLPAAVLPRVEWPAILRETTIEVFAIIVGIQVTAADHATAPRAPQLTAMVGIAGPLCATFSIRCSTATATLVASHMLGLTVEEAAAQMSDAVGEVCNVVAGYFKARVGLGNVCMLSVPTVLIGKDYLVHPRSHDVRLELPVLQEHEPLWITLDIRP